MILLIKLFLAHIIGDFFLQTDKWIADKEAKKWASPFLYIHALIHFFLVIAIVGSFGFWKPAAVIAATHLLIDLAKLMFQKANTKRAWFFIDQLLHLVILTGVWGFLSDISFDYQLLNNRKFLVITTSVLTLLYPASILIKTVISKWSPKSSANEDRESLQNAGKLIGFMERLLVLVFVLFGKWEGIGFLLAAKSVFRFGDLKDSKDMKLTEYVLIGTFLSFGIAVAVGLIAIRLLEE